MLIEIEPQEQEILKSVKIPVRPKVLLTVSEEAKKEEPSFSIISHAIAEDVSISSAILKMVNSAAFSRPSPISSIDQALNMLGLKRVLAIVNAVAVRNASQSNADLEEFWNLASNVAHASVIISKQLKRSFLGDDAYTLGLFHTAGVPIMIARFKNYTDFYHQSEKKGWTLSIDREKEAFHTTHSSIGALMAQEWCLPNSITNAIYNIHYADGIFDDSSMSETTQSLIGILKMARHLCHEYQEINCESDDWVQVESQVFGFLKISEDKWLVIRDAVINGLRQGN